VSNAVRAVEVDAYGSWQLLHVGFKAGILAGIIGVLNVDFDYGLLSVTIPKIPSLIVIHFSSLRTRPKHLHTYEKDVKN
jgi:hypothetical protein